MELGICPFPLLSSVGETCLPVSHPPHPSSDNRSRCPSAALLKTPAPVRSRGAASCPAQGGRGRGEIRSE